MSSSSVTSMPAPGRAQGNLFDVWQPRYATLGVVTFPVRFIVRGGKLDKVPAVKNYMRLGLRASTELTRRFADATGIGLALGQRSGLAVVDIDTMEENAVADALAFYGESPLIARTPSGGHHVYYRHDGRQRRRIRDPHWRERGIPVDLLGNGYVVVPPSISPKGGYRFVRGGLDDLQRLPVLRGASTGPTAAPPQDEPSPLRGMREHDGRNTALYRALAPLARDIHRAGGGREQLLEIARAHNAECAQPMEEGEVEKIVGNVWRMTCEHRNRVGQHGAWIDFAEVATMVRDDQDAMLLLTFLRANNGPLADFMCTNALAETFGWGRQRLAAARARLIELGHLQRIREATTGHPALYRWR